jgi:hypothetical protein
MSQLDIGVMINRLCGNRREIDDYNKAVGRKIARAEVKDDILTLAFTDGSSYALRDDRQSCCEYRYMVCDDDLTKFTNTNLMGITVEDGPDGDGDGVHEHEVQFLHVKTGKGSFTVSNHNEHNGYYGGFSPTGTFYEVKS